MDKKTGHKSWSSRQATAILAVDNIKVSNFAQDVLRRTDEGLISYDDARDEILSRARVKVAASQKMRPR